MAAARIVGIDLARFAAIAGMVLVNVTIVMGGTGEAGGWLGALERGMQGRASALFVVLAGIGCSVMARRDGRLELARRRILRRAVFLLVLGYAWQLVWSGDILHFYGFYFLVAAACLGVSSRVLWAAAAAAVLGWLGLHMVLDYGVGWRWTDLSHPDFWTPLGQARNLLYNGWHPLLPWSAFLLAGMALGRLDLGMPEVQMRLLLGGVAAGALAAVVSAAGEAAFMEEGALDMFGLPNDWRHPVVLLGRSSIPPTPLYVVAAGGQAVAVLAACLMAGSLWGGTVWAGTLAATGRMALTLYVVHVLFCLGVLEELGWPSASGREGAAQRTAVFLAVAVPACSLWLRFFRAGPLESVMRRLCG